MTAELFPIQVNSPVVGRRPSTGEKMQVNSGSYDAQWISTTSLGDPEQVGALRVLGADPTNGGPLDILQADWPDLMSWPKFTPNGTIERVD